MTGPALVAATLLGVENATDRAITVTAYLVCDSGKGERSQPFPAVLNLDTGNVTFPVFVRLAHCRTFRVEAALDTDADINARSASVTVEPCRLGEHVSPDGSVCTACELGRFTPLRQLAGADGEFAACDNCPSNVKCEGGDTPRSIAGCVLPAAPLTVVAACTGTLLGRERLR
jgi:hypothetical protein